MTAVEARRPGFDSQWNHLSLMSPPVWQPRNRLLNSANHTVNFPIVVQTQDSIIVIIIIISVKH